MKRHQNLLLIVSLLVISLSAVVIPRASKQNKVLGVRSSFLSISHLLGSFINPPAVPTPSNPFGIMLGNTAADETVVAKSLGARFYRSSITLTHMKDSNYKVPEVVSQKVKDGLESVLTVSYSGGRFNGKAVVSSAPDISILKANLVLAIDKIHPTIVVYENEEDSPNKNFFTGTNAEYLAGLKAVCEVAHQKGIWCTNGGITSGSSIMLTAYYYENEKPNSAMFKAVTTNTLGKEYEKMFVKAGNTMAIPSFQSRIKSTKELVTQYKAAGADFMNFHWYGLNSKALPLVANYLSKLSGLNVITNEFGLGSSTTPEEYTQTLAAISNLRMPIAVAYSFDDSVWGTKSLVNSDGTLRPEGEAYKQFILNLSAPSQY